MSMSLERAVARVIRLEWKIYFYNIFFINLKWFVEVYQF